MRKSFLPDVYHTIEMPQLAKSTKLTFRILSRAYTEHSFKREQERQNTSIVNINSSNYPIATLNIIQCRQFNGLLCTHKKNYKPKKKMSRRNKTCKINYNINIISRRQ